MTRLVRAVPAAVGAVLLLVLLMPQGAGAQEVPTLMVTPNTGLVDGQVVSLTGTGFAGITSIAGLECPAQFAGRTEFTINEVLSNCGFVAFADRITTDASGNLTGTATVQEVFTPSSLGGSYDCTVRDDCVILVAGLAGPGLRGATAPISFGAAAPTTKADCRNGGWRSFADDQGQPFRNQGHCVSFVALRD